MARPECDTPLVCFGMCKKKKPLGSAHLNNIHWNIAQNRIIKMKLGFWSTLEKIIVQKIVKFSKQAKLVLKKTGKSSGTKSKIMCQNWTWMCVFTLQITNSILRSVWNEHLATKSLQWYHWWWSVLFCNHDRLGPSPIGCLWPNNYLYLHHMCFILSDLKC